MKFKEFVKKNKWWLLVSSLLLVSTITLSIVLPISLKKERILEDLNNIPTNYDKPGENRVNLHSDIQKAYLKDKVENAYLYARGKEELSRPIYPEFSWEGEEKAYTVTLSEKPDYIDPTIYNVEKPKVNFVNLKIDTKYYYKVTSGLDVVKEDSFLTSSEIIRNMYVSGITNVRDLGGYQTSYGKVKQGLLYRTARLNESDGSILITEKGKNTILNDMKIKSEIDLRLVSNNEVGGLTEGEGVLGKSVNYYQCPMDYNELYTVEINLKATKRVFSLLSDKENYPMFFHCAIGTDRTGYIAFLINAILGVNESHIYRDYLFSNFGKIGSKRTVDSISDKYVNKIKSMNGNSLEEKVVNYLLEIGILLSQINSIRSILL